MVPLQYFDSDVSGWIDDMVDSRHSSVADQVAIKLDFATWIGRMCRRTRSIALDLA